MLILSRCVIDRKYEMLSNIEMTVYLEKFINSERPLCKEFKNLTKGFPAPKSNPDKPYYEFPSPIAKLEFTLEPRTTKPQIGIYMTKGYSHQKDMMDALNFINKATDGNYKDNNEKKGDNYDSSRGIMWKCETLNPFVDSQRESFFEWAVEGLCKLIPVILELHKCFENGRPEPEDIIAELKRVTEECSLESTEKRQVMAEEISRNERYAKEVKERANYRCQICGCEGFDMEGGGKYAEAHHVLELAKHLIDDPRIMICVCPTCHRIIHYGTEEELRKREAMNQ